MGLSAGAEITVSTLRELHLGGLIAKLRPQPEPVVTEGTEAAGHYRAVAEVYRTAVEAGKPPVLEVANRFEITHPIARRWVHIARNRCGLFPAVRRGQAG